LYFLQIEGKRVIKLIHGNILDQNVDAIVNAANTGLKRGGGVCGAIFRKAGFALDAYIDTHFPDGINPGEAAITPGFGCSQQSIIHAVGPVYTNARESSPILEKAYTSSLSIALEKNLGSIAFPAISTGIYGFPFHEATRIAVGSCLNSDRNIVLVFFSKEEYFEASEILKGEADGSKN
jgi:O-acetyl-ADP-ribose deacetylase (regulator of RNase III)